jgi:hypothetical protein
MLVSERFSKLRLPCGSARASNLARRRNALKLLSALAVK